ncbi:MAG: hypothetical protein IAF01_04020 [Xanthomonadaceae bacterium]|nr:hypothetical protein [Xanthomonadaceae bacterium]
MSRMSHLTDRALDLAEQAGAGLRQASASLRDAGVDAEQWIKTGAALGAAKAGLGYARGTVRRHPVAVATAAAVVGAGVLAYVLYRKGRKRRQQEAIEGQARRIASDESEAAIVRPRTPRRRRQPAKA